ncbi:MAG TPA: phosphoglycerate mutase family protein [Candidatus Saccharimonadales bacterium]|nr:phosphoglycerate mutase family protein [Candidatus Saccharimonadales bacterium]
MKYLIIRHAQTDSTRLNRHLDGPDGAPLNETGERAARALRDELTAAGIEVQHVKVAISELVRTRQTAEAAGFVSENMRVDPLLNEVNTPDPAATQRLVEQGKLPLEAFAAARAILDNPPEEPVWVTHGLVIAALRELLGLPGFIPPMASICEIEI